MINFEHIFCTHSAFLSFEAAIYHKILNMIKFDVTHLGFIIQFLFSLIQILIVLFSPVKSGEVIRFDLINSKMKNCHSLVECKSSFNCVHKFCAVSACVCVPIIMSEWRFHYTSVRCLRGTNSFHLVEKFTLLMNLILFVF